MFLGDAETGVYLFERTHNLTNHHKRGIGIKNSKSTVNRRKRYISTVNGFCQFCNKLLYII